MKAMNLLIVSNTNIFGSIILNLNKKGFSCNLVKDWDEVIKLLDKINIYDLVILNDNIIGITLPQMIQIINKKCPDVKLIIMIDNNNKEFSVSTNFNPIYHVFKKPFKIKEFLKIVNIFLKEKITESGKTDSK